jgi:GTP cyclohydrolase II
MLLDLNIKELSLITSTPKPLIDLSVFDLHINQQIPLS